MQYWDDSKKDLLRRENEHANNTKIWREECKDCSKSDMCDAQTDEVCPYEDQEEEETDICNM